MPEAFVPAYANWRPTKQIRDPKVFKSEQAQALREKPCACCGQADGYTLHHIVPRSQRGDDVIENLIGLNAGHHDLLHHAPDACERFLEIGRRLTPENIAYVIEKRGAAWLHTRYGVTT